LVAKKHQALAVRDSKLWAIDNINKTLAHLCAVSILIMGLYT